MNKVDTHQKQYQHMAWHKQVTHYMIAFGNWCHQSRIQWKSYQAILSGDEKCHKTVIHSSNFTTIAVLAKTVVNDFHLIYRIWENLGILWQWLMSSITNVQQWGNLSELEFFDHLQWLCFRGTMLQKFSKGKDKAFFRQNNFFFGEKNFSVKVTYIWLIFLSSISFFSVKSEDFKHFSFLCTLLHIM